MPYSLPPVYRFPYDFAIYLHDYLVGLVKAGEVTGIFNANLTLGPDDPLPPDRLEGSGLSAWLDRHYPKASAELAYKSLLRALVGDACHFVWESLHASARGKQTVAYDLSRKPFKDNLFYLEWLLVDPTEFLERFNRDPEQIAVGKQLEDKRRAIIAEAVRKSKSAGLNGSFLYEVRYDRSADFGYAVAWDQAIHLVTTFKQARTSPRNLNLIFSGEQERQFLWEHFYRLVPHLLYHFVYVADALYATIASFKYTEQSLHKIRRDLGFLLHSEWIMEREPSMTLKAASEQLQTLKCDKCGSRFSFRLRSLKAFIVRGSLECRECRIRFQLPQ